MNVRKKINVSLVYNFNICTFSFFDPVQHTHVSTHDAVFVNAGEAIIVYRSGGEGKKASAAATGKGGEDCAKTDGTGVERIVMKGPTQGKRIRIFFVLKVVHSVP